MSPILQTGGRCWKTPTCTAICLILSMVTTVWSADGVVSNIRTIRIIPRGDTEMELAHERARANACERISSNQPFEQTQFSLALASRERPVPGAIADPASRRQVFTVGLDMFREDQNQLPKLSRSAILKYLEDHCVSVQARIQKDHRSGSLYLHHRPMAATMNFTGVRLTQEFHEAVSDAVDDFRSLGLFVKPRSELTPGNLRTLVLVHRNRMISTTPGIRNEAAKSNYELVLIRARHPDAKTTDSLVLHVFLTSNQRKMLHHIQAHGLPHGVSDCSIRATVLFTSYESANLVPKESATRKLSIKSRTSFPVASLDDYCKTNGLPGDSFDNLTDVLDAVIDGKIRGTVVR